MIEVSNSVDVDTTREAAWDLLSDFEGVWEDSNPAHRGTKVLSEPKRPLRDGLRWWQREKVGPVQGEFVATLHDVVPEQEFSWGAGHFLESKGPNPKCWVMNKRNRGRHLS